MVEWCDVEACIPLCYCTYHIVWELFAASFLLDCKLMENGDKALFILVFLVYSTKLDTQLMLFYNE